MTTDPSVAELVPAPEPDSSHQPSIDDERAALLDVAGTLALIRPNSEPVMLDGIGQMLESHLAEIDANGKAKRERLIGETRATEHEIEFRQHLHEELNRLRERCTQLRVDSSRLDGVITGLESELIQRRHKAEDARLMEQIAALRDEERKAQRHVSERESLDETEARRTTIEQLERKYEHIMAAEGPALEREQALAARSITQTVSGFLLWLGYGSVAATGAVLALMFKGESDWQLGSLVNGWRVIVESFGINAAYGRLIAGVVLLAVLLGVVGSSIGFAEKYLKHRKGWDKDRRRRSDREPQINLSPEPITRSTYTQFLAILPFLFGAGIIATILTVSHDQSTTGGSDGVLLSALPTLGYAFVGIAIAFLATAVFVMYVIRIVEPRQSVAGDRAKVLRAGWEFIIPPFVLVAAVITTPFLLKGPNGTTILTASQWMPWAGFMLISSLCLACGIVYHGIFKDAKKAKDRIRLIETRLDMERGLVENELDDSVSGDDEELRRLEATLRGLQLARLGLTITGRRENDSVLERAWRWLRRHRPSGLTAGVPSVTPAAISHAGDYEISGDILANLAKARSERAFTVGELERIEHAIGIYSEYTSFDVMLPLVRRVQLLTGDVQASAAEDEERKNRARILGEMLSLHVVSVVASADAVKPFFDGVREELAGRVPHVSIPAPKGDEHE